MGGIQFRQGQQGCIASAIWICPVGNDCQQSSYPAIGPPIKGYVYFARAGLQGLLDHLLVGVKLILDPNTDCFAIRKDGTAIHLHVRKYRPESIGVDNIERNIVTNDPVKDVLPDIIRIEYQYSRAVYCLLDRILVVQGVEDQQYPSLGSGALDLFTFCLVVLINMSISEVMPHAAAAIDLQYSID
ncbi:hypothetical protein EJ04DRAFT_585588 [Polyplosphaeria fusca]|uniref:Uncharacterized protein n=1 Tax=Polyplosphaeria fusca TaxID=682080 RepID=A0A9P4UW27_9PLEO|nr:hypothetical protein EJ04DRAFT_585588 [Polyplosphaeria fusca]